MLDPPQDTSDGDIQTAAPTLLIRAAGGVVLGAGVLAVLVGIQTITGFNLSDKAEAILAVTTLVGIATAICGLMIMRARVWAAMAGIIASGLLCVATSVWLVFSLGGGLVSLFGLGAPFMSFAAIALSALALGPCKKASDARARLAEQGLDLGI